MGAAHVLHFGRMRHWSGLPLEGLVLAARYLLIQYPGVCASRTAVQMESSAANDAAFAVRLGKARVWEGSRSRVCRFRII